MAVRDKNVVAWAGLALSAVLALIAGVGFIVSIDGRLKSLEGQVGEVTKVINDIAPRKVKSETAAAAPLTAPLEVAAAGPGTTEQLFSPLASVTAAGPYPDPNDDTSTWPSRFVADHCRRCPACCVTLSTAALP